MYWRPPVRAGRSHDLQRPAVIGGGTAGRQGHVAIGLVDRDHIGDLQNAFLDALQLVAGPGQHQRQKEIDHLGHRGLGLADPHRLHQHHIKAGGLADDHALTRRPRDTAKRARCRRGANKRRRVPAQLLHPGFVTEDRASGTGAGRVDRQNGDPMSGGGQTAAKSLDEGAFPDTGHASNADPGRLARMRQQLGQHRICGLAVPGVPAFDQGDRLAQCRKVAGPHTGDEVFRRLRFGGGGHAGEILPRSLDKLRMR